MRIAYNCEFVFYQANIGRFSAKTYPGSSFAHTSNIFAGILSLI